MPAMLPPHISRASFLLRPVSRVGYCVMRNGNANKSTPTAAALLWLALGRCDWFDGRLDLAD